MKTTILALVCLALSVSCRSNCCQKTQEAPAQCPASALETPAAKNAQSMQDCNGNGIEDSTDIANGSSQDANLNAIPDECENH